MGIAVLVPDTPTSLIAAEGVRPTAQAALAGPNLQAPVAAELSVRGRARARYRADLAAVQRFRPAYQFWQHIFNIPDGRIIFGSGRDGRLLASFPTRGNWAREGIWEDARLAGTLDGLSLQSGLDRRRDQVEALLAPIVGPTVHNPTRGRFLEPHAERNGGFLGQWGRIYERFGVPAEIGLAQAIVESGLNGRARSRADARGFCQWLRRNWNYLNRLAPNVIEAYNQTTQAPYCAAHLTILATMYGSFIPALSEHHAGGVNVGRTVINGERLGGTGVREQYLMGSEFARDLRQISIPRYRDLFRTYGRRSFLYAEMVFGNTITAERLTAETPQIPIFAMRPRAISHSQRSDGRPDSRRMRSSGSTRRWSGRFRPGRTSISPSMSRSLVRTCRSGIAPPARRSPRCSTSSCGSTSACSAGTRRRLNRPCVVSSDGSQKPTARKAR